MDKPKFSKRLGAALVNFFVFTLLAVCLDYFLMPKTYKAALQYNEIETQINTKNEQFKELQDSYHIYIYDKDNNRIINPNVSKADEEAFKNDSRVKEIAKLIPLLEQKLILINVSSFLICYVGCALFINMAFSFILGKGNSFGGTFFGIRYRYENKEPVKAKTVIIYDLLDFIFHYILPILTLGIVSIVCLYQIYYNEKSQTFIERWLKIQYFVK